MSSISVPPEYVVLDAGNGPSKTIRDIAMAANVAYLTPYYLVLKKENVSESKHVVAVTDGGDFYEGKPARDFLGMPTKGKTSIDPKKVAKDVKVFVQSSSHNRKVTKGSMVLLQIDASKASSSSAPAASSSSTAKPPANATASSTSSSTSSPTAKPATKAATPSSPAAATATASTGADPIDFPFQVDYAKSARSTCNISKQKIAKGSLRIGVMVRSRHFDGFQPDWCKATKFFAGKKKHRKKKPTSVEDIGGFEDLRPKDQEKIAAWIEGDGDDDTKDDDEDKKVRADLSEQSRHLWEIKDITSKGKDALKPKVIKSILEANGKSSKGGGDDLIHRLATILWFGVPPKGDTAKGCCGKIHLRFSERHGRYVCGAQLDWGECRYSQSVSKTECEAVDIPEEVEKDNDGWLKKVAKICGEGFPPHKRIHLKRKMPSSTASPTPPKKKRKVTKTVQPHIRKDHLSRACVDPESGVDDTHHVYDMGYKSKGVKPDPTESFPTDLYDVTLCMTNIGKGFNSKYKLQLLVPDKKGTEPVYLWRVWGRVGDDGGGGTKLQEFDNVKSAKEEFCKLFKKQTRNEWADRKNFAKVPGAYYQMDVSYAADDDENGPSDDKQKEAVSAGDPSSRLPLRVQEIVASIFDVNAAEAAMKSLHIDVTKMPLGKMTEAQLKDAYSVLTQIDTLLGEEEQEEETKKKEEAAKDDDEEEEEQIGTCDSAFDVAAALRDGQLQQLSNQFYTKCPSTDPELINTKEILQSKIKMVDELLDLQISAAVMEGKNDDEGKKAPVDEAYEKLKTDIIPLDTGGPEWEMLDRYVNNTRNATAPGVYAWGCNDWEQRGLRMIDAFRVVRHGEAENFEENKSLGNRRLLWHGSRISNYGGILGQGLRIAPPEAPASGYRFGKGVYFADLLGKSANYCRTDGSSEMLVMACDVALGVPFETPRDMYMEEPQPGTHSTHALAQIIPDPASDFILSDNSSPETKETDNSKGSAREVRVPLGKAIANPGVSNMPHTPGCDVNEFIVYDQSQVNIKYLLRLSTNPATEPKEGKGGNSYDPSIVDVQSYAVPEIEKIGRKKKKLTLRLGKRKTDDSGEDTTTDKKLKSDVSNTATPAHRFIKDELEDYSAPSASGLKVLNSRTFAEGLRLTVVENDMMESKTEAIVIPSDSSLGLNGLIGQKLATKAGADLANKINNLVGSGFALDTSEACVLNDCGLPSVSSIVFVSSPVMSMQPSEDVAKNKLQEAVKNILRECSKQGLKTVTLPSIGSGHAGYDKGDAAKWIIAAISGYLEEAPGSASQQQSLREVCFCLYDNLSLQAYKEGILALEDSDEEDSDV